MKTIRQQTVIYETFQYIDLRLPLYYYFLLDNLLKIQEKCS
jgi:hypothetical protein